MALTYIYLIVLCLAAVTGALALKKKLPIQLKSIFILVMYTAILEGTVVLFKNQFSINKNVIPQYSIFLLVEFLFYAYFFKKIIHSKTVLKAINIFIYVFPVIWYVLVFGVLNILQWNSYVFVLGGTCTIFWGLLYYYQLFNSLPLVSLSKSSEFWIVTGIIIFYSCGTPYMGMYNFLTKNHESLAVELKLVLQFSNIVMYSLFAYAFVCHSATIKIRK